MSDLNPLLRDYLAEIYQAGHIEPSTGDRLVTSGELAERLAATQSTVNRVIERLRDAGLIQHERYAGVRLTPAGLAAARHTLRRQAILETFLVQVMGFPWHEAYTEALRLRHHVGEVVLSRMWEMTGHAAHSPFGEWIGEGSGEGIDPPAGEAAHDVPLAEAEPRQDYRIARILTRQADRLEYLAALGLKPGVRLHLLHKAPFSGPLQLHLEREYRIVGHNLAGLITVRAADDAV